MDPTTRARLAAGLVAAGGVALVVLGRWAIGAPLVIAAAGVAVLVLEQDTPEELPQQAVEGTMRAGADLVGDLGLTGRGLHVIPETSDDPTGAHAGPPRVFVPAKDVDPDELAPLATGETIHRSPPGALGLDLVAPGDALVRAWATREGLPVGKGTEEAALHLKRALPDLGVGEDVTVHADADHVRVDYTHTALGEACRLSRVELAPWDVQGGCPTCSFVASLVAHAHQAPVRYRGVDALGDGRVALELEVLA